MFVGSGLGRGNSSKIALVDSRNDVRLSYAQLNEKVQAFGGVLNALHVQLAFLFAANTLESVLFYLGCLSGRVPVVLLDARLPPSLKQDLVARYSPGCIFSASAAPQASFGSIYHVQPIEGLEVLVKEQEPLDIHPALGLLLTTSGSTGSPKLVRLTVGSVEANAASIADALRINAEDVAITSLPMHYSYGLSVLNSHLIAGAKIVLSEPAVMSAEFWKLARQEAVTFLAGVPYTFDVLERLDLERLSLPGLKKLTVAGGKLRDDLVSKYHKIMTERNGEFFVMYGQTEATARIAILAPELLPVELGAVGAAIPGGRLEVKEPDANGVGEIIYHGPNVMLGYAQSLEDLALGDVNGGVLSTGDLGYLNDRGSLYVTGRLKRIAKIFGYRIDLDEVESILRRHCPVAAISDDANIFIFTSSDCEQNVLRETLESMLSLHSSVFVFRHIDNIPVLSNGKLDYASLRKLI